MMPPIGSTCAFSFTSRFALLDGVYKVRAETTFVDALSSGIDFVTNLYTPAGLSRDDFTLDYTSYQTDMVAVLEKVTDATVVYYAPESTFGVPDPTIKAYYPLILVADLGVQSTPQAIVPLMGQIKDLIQASIGATDPVRIVTDPANKTYLTQGQYDVLEAAREANKSYLSPLSLQLKQALDANTILAAKCAAYEAALALQDGA